MVNQSHHISLANSYTHFIAVIPYLIFNVHILQNFRIQPK